MRLLTADGLVLSQTPAWSGQWPLSFSLVPGEYLVAWGAGATRRVRVGSQPVELELAP